MCGPNELFPPKVPCQGPCEYGACGDPGQYSGGPYGCGGCCRCLGGCRVEYEVEQMFIPQTRDEHETQLRWERFDDKQDNPF